MDHDDTYTYDQCKWVVVFSKVGSLQSVASSRVGVQFYKHLCPCDYSCYKTWIDSSILIILTNKIYISETKKLTLGHGHGQGKVKYVIIQKFVLTINHERMIGFWSYLYIWLISMN